MADQVLELMRVGKNSEMAADLHVQAGGQRPLEDYEPSPELELLFPVRSGLPQFVSSGLEAVEESGQDVLRAYKENQKKQDN